MTDDQGVLPTGSAAYRFSDPGLFRACHQVVDEHAEAAAGGWLKLLDNADEIVDTTEVFDDNALDAQVVAPHLLDQFGVVPALDVDPAGQRDLGLGLHR